MPSHSAPELTVLLASFAATRCPRVRAQIVVRHKPLVRSIAQKFVRPGIALEDLVQTGWIGLIRALDRFDPALGHQFSTYAITCITGELKRYFRDRTWSLKVPRDLQDLAMRLDRLRDQAYTRLGRPPTVGDIAEAAGVSEERIIEAMEVARSYIPANLDAPRQGESGEAMGSLGELIGAYDPTMEAVTKHAPLMGAIASLESRDQQIIRRRFFAEWSQERVAAELGVSQMHVSRLERRALVRLKELMAGADLLT